MYVSVSDTYFKREFKNLKDYTNTEFLTPQMTVLCEFYLFNFSSILEQFRLIFKRIFFTLFCSF